MPNKTQKAIVLYLPVLHEGYVRFFEKYKDVDSILIVGEDIISQLDYLRKDLRAIRPSNALDMLKKLLPKKHIAMLKKADVSQLNNANQMLIMPDDDVSEWLAANLGKAKIEFYPIFLRWDRRATEKQDAINPDRTVTTDVFHKEMAKLAQDTSVRSSNIWRRVGAAVVKNKKILYSGSNKHLPTENSIWIDGDPRSTSNRGVGLEITTDMHAEARLIARAAKDGVALKGASIYVSTFPCPPCAKLVAEAGFSHCYYSAGYATLDGEELLKAYGVELVFVESPENLGHKDSWALYPEKPKKKAA